MATLLCVGVDVASRLNKAQFLDDTEHSHGRISFPNEAGGAVRLVAETCRIATKTQVTQIRFGIEATAFYGWYLALYLERAPELASFDSHVYLFNPRVIRAFKKSFTDLPKTDWIDAYVIAERLRIGRLPHPFHYDERYLPLRHRHFLVKQLVRHKNYFLGYLFLKCSRLVQACPISDPLGAAGSALITEYCSAEDIAATPLGELASFLTEKSCNKPYDVAKALKAAARHSYRLPDKLKEPVNRILASTLQIIRDLEREIRATDKAIEREMRDLNCQASVLSTLPGSWRSSATCTTSQAMPPSLNSLASPGVHTSQASLKVTILRFLGQVTPTCATTCARQPIAFGDTRLSMPPTTSASTKKRRSISINERSS